MTKEEFKQRWESGEDGGGIQFRHFLKAMKEWDIARTPELYDPAYVLYEVLSAASTVDAESYNPEN